MLGFMRAQNASSSARYREDPHCTEEAARDDPAGWPHPSGPTHSATSDSLAPGPLLGAVQELAASPRDHWMYFHPGLRQAPPQ